MFEDRPTRIKICGVTFKVQWDVDIQDEGSIDFKEMQILIAPSASESMQLDTLIHEILHAIWYFYNLRKREKEERVVSTIASGLNCVLSNNQSLLKYINQIHGG